MAVRVLHGDMREQLQALIAEGVRVQSVVTDPPYGIGFMSRAWDQADNIAFRPETWRLCFELLPPGGHFLAFAGTRTYHRMACAIEDAGFEIRDTIAWLYGSGFPKSHNVSKGIDRHAGRIGACIIALKQRLIELADASGKTRAAIDAECGFRATNYLTLPAEGKRPDPWVNCLPPADKWQRMKAILGCGNDLDAAFSAAEREIVGQRAVHAGLAFTSEGPTELDITAPATDAARQWDGWGTALKPAMELICVARKPLIGTVAANVLAHGTGALNIDGCRIATNGEVIEPVFAGRKGPANGGKYGNSGDYLSNVHEAGRWPANVVHDGSAEVVKAFPDSQSGASVTRNGGGRLIGGNGIYGGSKPHDGAPDSGYPGESGSAARFFYSSKADADDRLSSKHPTVKPVDLMRWLVRLVTPPGGTCLDPFAGSGTTGMACMAEGFDCILVEREAEYVADIKARIAHVRGEDTPLFAGLEKR